MSYSKKQIAEISGLTPRLIQFYTEEGLIKPEKGTGTGRGNFRSYSRESLLDFLLIKELSNFGAIKAKMKLFLDHIHEDPQSVSYVQGDLHKKGVKLFIHIFATSAGKVTLNFQIVSGSGKDTPILKIEDLSDYSSCVLIDFGKLVEKAKKA